MDPEDLDEMVATDVDALIAENARKIAEEEKAPKQELTDQDYRDRFNKYRS